MSSTAFQTLKRIPDSPIFFEDLLPLRGDFFWAYPAVFISRFFFKKIYFCHKVRTQHKLIQGEEKKKKHKKTAADLLLNWEQRWPIKGLLETHHYSHFGLETLTGKHHHVLNFIFRWCGYMWRWDRGFPPCCLRVRWAGLSAAISGQQERCKLRDKSQQ